MGEKSNILVAYFLCHLAKNILMKISIQLHAIIIFYITLELVFGSTELARDL